MNRSVLYGVLLVLGAATPAAAHTNTYFGFQIGISNAPRHPAVIFREEPRVVVVPSSRVYVVEDDDYDCDVFRYGPYWYVSDRGYWYRARDYRGPFAVVDVRYVPRPIFAVPEKHWKYRPHGGPHGHTRKEWAPENGKRGHGHDHEGRHGED